MIKKTPPDTFNFKPVGVARRRPIYQKVFDPRKRRIRGLRKRNGWFYAQMAVTDNLTGKKAARRVRLIQLSASLVFIFCYAPFVLFCG
jgi:hypothetical protein